MLVSGSLFPAALNVCKVPESLLTDSLLQLFEVYPDSRESEDVTTSTGYTFVPTVGQVAQHPGQIGLALTVVLSPERTDEALTLLQSLSVYAMEVRLSRQAVERALSWSREAFHRAFIRCQASIDARH
jgi:hypothetical protein